MTNFNDLIYSRKGWKEINPPIWLRKKFKKYKKNYRRYYNSRKFIYRVIDLLKDDKGDRRTFYFRKIKN